MNIKQVTCSIAALAAIASSAIAQGNVTVPAHTSIYNGFSRGFSTVAQFNFEITELEIPTDAFQPTDTASFLIQVNGADVFHNVGGTNAIAVVSPPVIVLTGDVVMVIAHWSGTPTSNFSAHNSYAGGAGPYATTILGVAHTLDRAGYQCDIGDATSYGGGTANGGAISFNGIAGSIGRCFVTAVSSTGWAPASMVGASEATPFANTLSATPPTFGDNDFVRWNFVDPLGANLGLLSVVGWNFATLGVPSTGTTAQLPGFQLLSQASTPVGTLFTVGPYSIGAADNLTVIPPGIFSTGDSIKIQGAVLDPVHALGALPFVITNVVEFTYVGAWSGSEDFDNGLTLPLGWTNSGTSNWSVDANGTGSTGTGPTAANSLPNYLYCETSIAHPGLFIVDTPSLPSSSAPNNLLEFQLSRIGATIATLDVKMDDGTGTNTFVTIATYTGADPGQAQGAVEWSFESIDITNGGTIVPPANLIFRFEYSGTTSFTADIAIDDLSVN